MEIKSLQVDFVARARNTDTGLETYHFIGEYEVNPLHEWMARFDSLVAGQYEISATFPVRHATTTYRGKSFRATVEAGETTIVFIGVHLLA